MGDKTASFLQSPEPEWHLPAALCPETHGNSIRPTRRVSFRSSPHRAYAPVVLEVVAKQASLSSLLLKLPNVGCSIASTVL